LENREIYRLLEDCKQGNERAQLSLYQTFSKQMFQTSFRILKDQQTAEDAMQEGFIKAFTKLSSYKNEAPFESWLRKIITNEALTIYRKNKRRNEFELIPELTDSNDQSTQEKVSYHFTVENIQNAMTSLKDNYRIALNLFLLEGYSYEELSNYLDISNGNCRTLISRAKQQLRSELEKYER